MQFETEKKEKFSSLRNFGNGLRVVTANNPGPMTFRGTCTYLLGFDSIAVIDPGPVDLIHLDLIMTALNGSKVSKIILTHTHSDHSGLAKQ